jgi:hypothetical protein
MTDIEVCEKKDYAILRLAKIRSLAELSLVDKHDTRKIVSENILEQIAPRELLPEGSDDFVASARAKLNELAIPLPRPREKVLAVEVLMTASGRWFDQADDDRKQEWLDRNVAWLSEKFGRGLISAKLHLDEEVWHIHAVALPVVLKERKKRGRPHRDLDRRRASDEEWAAKPPRWTLSFQDLFGGHKMELSRLQDEYHAVVADLGLERGEKSPTDWEIELGDGLTIPIPVEEMGRRRKSIPPQDYRAIIKRMRGEAEAALARAKEFEATAKGLVDDLKAKQSSVNEQAAALKLLAGQYEDRTRALQKKDENLKRRETAVHADTAVVRKRELTITAAEETLAAARRQIAAAQTSLAAEQNAVAEARSQADKSGKDLAAREAHAQKLITDAEGAARLAGAREVAAENQIVETEAANLEAKALKQEAERLRGSAAADADLYDRQIKLLARGTDEESGLGLTPTQGDGFAMLLDGMTTDEKEAYQSPWKGPMLRIGRLLSDALAHARRLIKLADEKLRTVLQREQEVEKKEKSLAAWEKQLKLDRDMLDIERERLVEADVLLERSHKKATAFEAAWEAVPEHLRPVEVVTVADAAHEFSAERLRQHQQSQGDSGR